MKLVKPSVEIMSKIDGEEILKHIEAAGRTAYKSESKTKDGSSHGFVRGIIKSGHESVVEHVSLTVRFTCSRAASHQLVRHRLASYTQSSQRYCCYAKDQFDNQVTFIEPEGFDSWLQDDQDDFLGMLSNIETVYLMMIGRGNIKVEDARLILPNACMTEVVATMNLRSWRHFFKLRCDKHAQAEIRNLAIDLLGKFETQIPVIFEDLAKQFNVLKSETVV